MDKGNPGTTAAKAAEPTRKRIPMSAPQRRLEVPAMEGYHLHWFKTTNVPRAFEAGYELVHAEGVKLNQVGVGTPVSVSGNTDLGSSVSIAAGVGEDGQPDRLYLMRIREEWFKEDSRILEQRNSGIMQQIFQGETVPGAEQMEGGDRNLAYVDGDKTGAKKGNLPLFNRPARKVQRPR